MRNSQLQKTGNCLFFCACSFIVNHVGSLMVTTKIQWIMQ
ncbi:hypothetical protein PAGA_a1980 [Pseudoalteromonas agarivorans DSM 14585]|uniref:Uncharacterized protein n=1 Tax=Pseudoalteromonas agarivorans DSM 14585 TaxID=1312369 RepID=A0ACA8DVX5_9GAMM|nr:hypothetical protein PAGA_a1980 [Pseudoalteromonas agarivorans DSM 14585]